jgi:hypothetical protein
VTRFCRIWITYSQVAIVLLFLCSSVPANRLANYQRLTRVPGEEISGTGEEISGTGEEISGAGEEISQLSLKTAGEEISLKKGRNSAVAGEEISGTGEEISGCCPEKRGGEMALYSPGGLWQLR